MPDLVLLAAASGMGIDNLAARSGSEGWSAPSTKARLRDRLSRLTDRVITLLEQPDDATFADKERLDAATALLRAIEKLKDAVKAAEAEADPAAIADEALVRDAYLKIDLRITELAHALAEKLVDAKPDTAASGTGAA